MTYKTTSTKYLQFPAQVEVTQNFAQYLKFDLCDTSALFNQLSDQVNWELNHGMGAS